MKAVMRHFAAVLALWACAVAPAQADHPAPFLWEVQGAKAKHYLLGSVHVLPKAAHPLPAALDAAYAASGAAMFETDIVGFQSPEMQARMLGAATETREGGIRARVGKGLYQKLQKRAKGLGMPPTACDAFRVWFCALLIENTEMQQAGFDAAFGVDQYFYGKARDDGRAVDIFETPQQQLDLFTGMSDALATDFLAATLEGATDSSMDPEKLAAIWRNGDLAALDKEMHELRGRHREIYARLLAERNRAWLPKLEERLAGAVPQFIVVGAAHFAGPDGLPALLRARGYDVVPAAAATPAVGPDTATVTPLDPRPAGAGWLTPHLTVRDVGRAAAFYRIAFGFVDAEARTLRYRDLVLMLEPESPKDKRVAPVTGGSVSPVVLELYVDDVDATVMRAQTAGAEILETPSKSDGQRSAMLRDPEGYRWRVAAREPAKGPSRE